MLLGDRSPNHSRSHGSPTTGSSGLSWRLVYRIRIRVSISSCYRMCLPTCWAGGHTPNGSTEDLRGLRDLGGGNCNSGRTETLPTLVRSLPGCFRRSLLREDPLGWSPLCSALVSFGGSGYSGCLGLPFVLASLRLLVAIGPSVHWDMVWQPVFRHFWRARCFLLPVG